MTQPDLQERLHSLGYDQRDPTLDQHLYYYQLSPWPPLDTPAGGQRLLKEALSVNAQLVVIDTLIRTVSGEENSADMIKDFNRYTGTPLKAAGIALLRIDHAGKDLTRGQRGTSAKRDDVDVVWLLKPATGNLPGKTMLTLKREAARVDWIQEDIHITRNEGPPLAHTIPTVLELTSADIAIVHYLQDQGLWRHNVTTRNAREALSHSTHTAPNIRLNHVVKWMQRYGENSPARKTAHTQSNQAARSSEEGKPRSATRRANGAPPKPKKQGKTTRNTTWVNALVAPATAKNTTSPPSSPVPAKSPAAATQDPTSNGEAATSSVKYPMSGSSSGHRHGTTRFSVATASRSSRRCAFTALTSASARRIEAPGWTSQRSGDGRGRWFDHLRVGGCRRGRLRLRVAAACGDRKHSDSYYYKEKAFHTRIIRD